MDNTNETIFEPNTVSHPGETVLEYLDFHGWSQRDLSRRTGLTPKTISEICNSKTPITPPTALAFEKVFQRPAHLWLNPQRQFDESEARCRESEKSLQWNDWVRNFPIKEMKDLNFSLPVGRSDTDALLNFFGVSSPTSRQSVWKASAAAYRQTRTLRAVRSQRPVVFPVGLVLPPGHFAGYGPGFCREFLGRIFCGGVGSLAPRGDQGTVAEAGATRARCSPTSGGIVSVLFDESGSSQMATAGPARASTPAESGQQFGRVRSGARRIKGSDCSVRQHAE
jgi:addiction module HigA family antidote